MFKGLFFALLLFLSLGGYSQRVVISEDLRSRDEIPEFGMNRKHFRHLYTGFHFAAGKPDGPGAQIRYGRSWAFDYGLRYKRRFNNTFSAGYDVAVKRSSFSIRQQDGKLVPYPTAHEKEKLVFLTGEIGLYTRINYGRRGDFIGRFIDFGAYGDWYFNVRHVAFDEVGPERIRTRRVGMEYHERLGYGLLVRLGFNNIVGKGTYRMSGLFRPESGLPELPRFTVGLEMGLHRL
jgi:hypothetical protein